MQKTTATTIAEYNALQTDNVEEICNLLTLHLNKHLKNCESKIWHGSPVWFLAGNPVVAYSIRKDKKVSLMFFSGQSFEEKDLIPEGKFKAAEIFYSDVKEIKVTHLKRWLTKAKDIQWDYKNIVKNKGLLEKINTINQIKDKESVHSARFGAMTFASIYPLYIAKIEKKGRTKKELDQMITWLTGMDSKKLKQALTENITFETLFKQCTLNPNAHLITGSICGYRVEDIKDPLVKKVRYLDKLVDELAKGRTMDKILRSK